MEPSEFLTIDQTQIAVPCGATSPLISAHNFGFGFAFGCALTEGHDGEHAQTFTWIDGHGETSGIVEARWTD